MENKVIQKPDRSEYFKKYYQKNKHTMDCYKLRQYYYVININGINYVFDNKKDIQIKKMKITDTKQQGYIKVN